MPNQNIDAVDRLDAKEILSLVESAAELFGSTEMSFRDVGAIFEAITALAPQSTIGRLADLGKGLCEQREFEFAEQQFAYKAHLERFDSTLPQSTGACNG